MKVVKTVEIVRTIMLNRKTGSIDDGLVLIMGRECRRLTGKLSTAVTRKK